MAIFRRAQRRSDANIWPGFVDAMTALLLVLTFVLSIFMIVQFVLRETISGQESELDSLSEQIAGLAEALGLEERKSASLENELQSTQGTLKSAEDQIAEQFAVIQGLISDNNRQKSQIAEFETQVTNFETQVANLLARQSDLETKVADRDAELAREISEKEAAQLALATARNEIDQQVEAARLAAAQREALEAMIADLNSQAEERGQELVALDARLKETLDNLAERDQELSETERQRLVEQAAAESLRQRLAESDAELTAMTLALEEQRQNAENTLTLLAAAEAAQKKLQSDLDAQAAQALSDAERQAALLAQANALISEKDAASAEDQRRLTLLNQQTLELRRQLDNLQGLLDDANAKDSDAQVQIELLGSNLNAALARVVSEERARAQAEEEKAEAERGRAEAEKERAEAEARERELLEAEARDLRKFRSEFFGRLREIFEGQERVRIVGDRFVFSSEVLFDPGSAELGFIGRREIASVASILRDVASQIPSEIDWILRVDGHTDKTPIGITSEFDDNWDLSQARALSVVRYLINDLEIPAERLAANGFGEFQPIDPADTPEAYSTNRRIELKFTEK